MSSEEISISERKLSRKEEQDIFDIEWGKVEEKNDIIFPDFYTKDEKNLPPEIRKGIDDNFPCPFGYAQNKFSIVEVRIMQVAMKARMEKEGYEFKVKNANYRKEIMENITVIDKVYRKIGNMKSNNIQEFLTLCDKFCALYFDEKQIFDKRHACYVLNTIINAVISGSINFKEFGYDPRTSDKKQLDSLFNPNRESIIKESNCIIPASSDPKRVKHWLNVESVKIEKREKIEGRPYIGIDNSAKIRLNAWEKYVTTDEYKNIESNLFTPLRIELYYRSYLIPIDEEQLSAKDLKFAQDNPRSFIAKKYLRQLIIDLYENCLIWREKGLKEKTVDNEVLILYLNAKIVITELIENNMLEENINKIFGTRKESKKYRDEYGYYFLNYPTTVQAAFTEYIKKRLKDNGRWRYFDMNDIPRVKVIKTGTKDEISYIYQNVIPGGSATLLFIPDRIRKFVRMQIAKYCMDAGSWGKISKRKFIDGVDITGRKIKIMDSNIEIVRSKMLRYLDRVIKESNEYSKTMASDTDKSRFYYFIRIKNELANEVMKFDAEYRMKVNRGIAIIDILRGNMVVDRQEVEINNILPEELHKAFKERAIEINDEMKQLFDIKLQFNYDTAHPDTDNDLPILDTHRVYRNDAIIIENASYYGGYVLNNRNNIKGYNGITTEDSELEQLYKQYNDKNCVAVFLFYYMKHRSGNVKNKRVYKSIDEVFSEEIKKDDTDLLQLYQYANKINVSVYCIDPLGNPILRYVSDDINRKYKPLYCLVANNHIYSISDPDMIKSIIGRRTKLKDGYRILPKAEKKERKYNTSNKNPRDIFKDNYIIYENRIKEIERKGNPTYIINIKKTGYTVYFTDKKQEKLNEYFLHYYRNTKTILRHEFKDNTMKLKKLYIDTGITYVNNPNILQIWECHKYLKTIPKDSFTGICSDLTELLPPSSMNYATIHVLKSFSKFTESLVYEPTEKAHSVDITRAFAYVLTEVIDRFISIGPERHFENYDNEDINIRYFYMISTNDRYCFDGNGIYLGKRVLIGLKDGIISRMNIIKVLKYSYTKSGNKYRDELIRRTEMIPYDIRKPVINHHTGMLYKTKESSSKSTISTNGNVYPWYGVNCNVSRYEKVDDIELFKITVEKERIYQLNYMPIYMQILDETAILVYLKMKEMKKMGIKIVGRKVDAIQYVGKEMDLPLKKDIKEYGVWVKEEDKKLKDITETGVCINSIEYFGDNTQNGNTLYHGIPGTGKTESLLKEMIKYEEEGIYKICCLTFMHSAEDNIKIKYENKRKELNLGRTSIDFMVLDKLFGIRQDYDLFFIDEIFCMPIKYLYILYKLKGLKIAAGDKYQLFFDMFEDESEGDNDTIDSYINIIGYMFPIKIELTEYHRGDKDLYNLLSKNPENPDISNVNRITPNYDEEEIHIVYTNKKRKEILSKYVKKGLDKLPDAPYMSQINSKDTFNGEMKLYKDIKKNLDGYELAYAMTAHKSQGRTIHKRVIIHEVDKMTSKLDRRLLYSALGRPTKFSNLFIAI